MRKLALALSLLLLFSGTNALAATKKPTPKPTAKVSTKATAKPKATATATTKAKPTAKPKATATATTKAKPTATATAKASVKPKPKPKPKPKKRKKVRLTPSPRPKWPPVGFEQSGDVFAKVPSSKELVGVISSKKNLASQVLDCETYICGAVQVASENGCLWWEVNSNLLGVDRRILGTLTTLSWTTLPREIKTILLISPELLETQARVTGISVVCHREAKPEGTPSVTYRKAEQ